MRNFLLITVLTPFFILAAGFTGLPVFKPLAIPSVNTASVATAITDTGATSGGNVTSDGGESVTGRGVAYDVVPNIPDTSGTVTMDGTGTGIFSSPITGLTAETEYNVRAYAYNSDGVAYGLTESFWTLSVQPSGAIGEMATTVSATQIDLSFNDLATYTNADGFYILRRDDMTDPTVTNGAAPTPGEIIANITTTGVTSFNDTGLTPSTQYNYLIVPYNFNSTDDETYHYLTGGTVNATTDAPASSSTVASAGNEGGNLLYASFQTGNINNTTQGVRVWSITITDGPDTDALPTIVDDITFSEGTNNTAGFAGTLRAAALFNGAAEIADGSIAGSDIDFTNLNLSVAQGTSVTLDLYVSFDNTVTDGQQLQFEVTTATTSGVSSDFAALGTVESTHTAGTSNRIEVVATRLDFTSNPSGSITEETNFSATIVAEDANNNVDTDSNASVTLTGSGAGTLSSATGLVQNLSNGTYSWADLQFDVVNPGNSTVTATAAGLTSDDFTVNVLVPGCIVTPAAPIEFCERFTNIALGPIVITEGAPDDFGVQGAGEQQVFTIQVPSGYRFIDNPSAVNISETNPGPTDIDMSSIEQIVFRNGDRNFQFEYEMNGTSNLDEITITGLVVRKTGTDQITNQPIIRVASTIDASSSLDEIEALMNGNGPTQQDHGTINFGGVDNATLEQVGGTSTFCIGQEVSFQASGGDNYEFFINGMSQQDGASSLYITGELVDGDIVSATITNTSTGCDATIALPAMVAETEPIVNITQPASGDILVLGSEPISLVAEDSVGAAVTTNGGIFTGPFVTNEGGNNFSFSPDAVGTFDIFYTFSAGGCFDTDTVTIEVQDFGQKLIDNLADQYCNTDAPVPIVWNQPGLILCGISGPGISGSLGAGYVYDPTAAGAVGSKDILIDFYPTGEQIIIGRVCFPVCTINGFIISCKTECNDITTPRTCGNFPPIRFKQTTILFNTPNVGFDTPLNPYYCEDDNIFANGNFPGGEFELTGPGVQGGTNFKSADGSGEASWNIIGEGIGVGPRQLTYIFSDPSNGGCENSITTNFEVLAIPPDATVANAPDSLFFCIGDEITPLSGTSNDFNQYTLAWYDEAFDPVPLDTGLVFDISFIDSLTSSVNVFYVANAHKVFTDCEGVRKPVVVTVGVIPEADFQVTGLCRSDTTRFTDLSTISQGDIDTWLWDFGDGDTSTEQNPSHKYDTPGTYTVSLTARSERNCEDVITREITVFPELTAASFPYLQDFNAGPAGWVSKSLEGELTGLLFPNSWQLQAPDGAKVEVLDGNSWITDNGSQTYDFLEKSWVECPCLDLSALERPMVSFDIWTDTELGVDGAVLQITVDDGLTWYEIGDDQSGVNWYDSRGLPSNPGQQSVFNFGWSGPEREWRTAKYALNSFLDSLDTDSRVRLRVAFGSNASNPGETDFGGIAFDNFFIGNRNRKVLIEHFTNQNSASYAAENTEYNDFINLYNTELVNLRYHIDFPEPDDLYLSNPAVPGARAIYYGISETSNNAIDGEFNPQPLGDWGDNFFNTRTLEAAPYQIDFTFDSDPAESLNVNVNITTTSTIAAREDTLDLYIAVVESFPDMTNVVRQMMPDVSGTRINWPAGDTTETYSFSQLITNIDNTANVGVIAFLQNSKTKEIHQAADTIPPSVPSIVTGIDDELLTELNVELYPNPTRDMLNLNFSRPLSKDTEWEVYNSFGQLVSKGVFLAGEDHVAISNYDLAQGVYILRLNSDKDKEKAMLKKFMIIK